MHVSFKIRGRLLATVGVILCTSLPSRAATVRVPQDAPTIQAGVDLTIGGDTVLVAAGSWNELVNLNGRNDLTLRGSGIDATFVQGPGVGPAFALRGCNNVTIEGFRFSSEIFGGDSFTDCAILLDASTNITVHHVFITAQAGNGVLILENSELHAYENIIVKVGDDAISFRGNTSDGVIHDNTFADNGTRAGIPGGSGIGVYTKSAGNIVVFNNIFHGNDYGLALEGGASVEHDFNLIGGSGIQDCYNCTLALDEQSCPPDFVDPLNLDYHIGSASCAIDAGTLSYSGAPSADLDIDYDPKPLGAAPEQGADEVGCSTAQAGWRDLVRLCEGETARLDATTITLPDCPTAPTRTWTDDPFAPQVRDVTPSSDTTYEVTASCPSLPGCTVTRTVLVAVDHRPDPFIARADDVAPCNLDIVVTWDATTFHGPGGSGTYSIYRSEISCLEARSRSALVSGLTTTRWLDVSAQPGIAYFYVVEAEDDASPTACTPGGPNGGATTLACVATPVVDAADLTPPVGPGAAVLRARNVDDEVTMYWPTARALLSNEHFHLVKTTGRPTGAWSRVNLEGDLSTSFTETDTTAWLQCFLVRVANTCEIESSP